MINTLIQSLGIEITYTINSFIYILSKLPILRDLITNDIYKSKFIKGLVGVLVRIFLLARAIFLKFMYFFVIFFISSNYFNDNMIHTFFHIYFLLTILGMFINNKLLDTNKKKYFSIILFNTDATNYFRANLFFNTITNLILNSVCLWFFISYILKAPTIMYTIMFILLTTFIRFVGEALNIMFYRKYKYIWYSNTSLYFPIVIVLFGLCFLPCFKIFIPISFIIISTIIFVILGIISFIYLMKIKDYKLIYKKLTQVTNVMNSKYEKDYLRQAMVDVKDKDKKIDSNIIKNKHGYDMFNTIFFERHKEILLRSARKYSFICIVIYIILGYLMLNYNNYFKDISDFMHNKLSWFIVIMFFINRGAIITQAMFFNCDHAMLRYNFYREPDTILALFKKRLLTVVKVNLLPGFVIGIGNIILLVISKDYNILMCLTTFLFIISLSVFFSVHYLILYYLLQPFNKNLEVKRASYSFATMFTYIISYWLTGLVFNPIILSVFGVLFMVLYIVLSLFLVNRYAPSTFKL